MASAASAESRPVAVDVVVTDKHGVPVPNLRKEDFVVLDNKQAQTISLFEEHPIRLTERIAPTQPPGSVTNVPTTPPDAVNVLLLDELNTPPDPAYVRKPILNYLKTIPPGMQLAVFALGSRLWMLQGPAADSSRLLAALDNKDGKTSALAGASMENGEPTGRDAQPLMRNSLGAFQADTPGFPFDVRTRLTLAAFQQLARYLSGVPGRKNVIWFSQLFPLSPNALASASQVGSAPRHETDEEYAAALRPTLDLLAWARVAIYPVDSRGVLPAGVGRFASINAGSGSTPEHHDMKLLAESTGGEAFYDTSQLKDALTRLTAVGGHYYTLTYQPANRKEDGGFRNIVVKLNDGSYRLAYRRGYYADPPFSPSSVASDILDPVFRTALEPSGPPATQILLKVRASPTTRSTTPPTRGASVSTQGPTGSATAISFSPLWHTTRITSRSTPSGTHCRSTCVPRSMRWPKPAASSFRKNSMCLQEPSPCASASTTPPRDEWELSMSR
jgi:VWFA-related protein